MRIDAHIHLWRRADGDDIWLPRKIGGLNRDFTYADWCALADEAGIDRVVVVQAAHDKSESRRLFDLARTSPRIAGIVAWTDLADPALGDWIAECRAAPKFVGFRPLPRTTFGADWLGDPAVKRGLALLEAQKIAVDILVTWRHLRAAAELLKPFAGLNVVLNHCGRPDTMTGQMEPWSTDLGHVAALPNVAVKCSGLIERAGIEWTPTSLKPYVARVIDAFGPSRTMFATNWPVMEIGGKYGAWPSAFASIGAEIGCAPGDIEAMFGATARRVYGI